MPPSEHHRQRFARNLVHRPVRRQETLQASSTSQISQQAPIFPSNAGVESRVGSNVAVAGATVAIAVVVGILFCSAGFFLVRYRRKRRKAMLESFPDDWSWVDVEGRPQSEQQKPEEHADSKVPPISRASKESGTVLCDVIAQAHNPKTVARSPGMDENHTSPLGSPSNFHLPSFTFALPSPVTPAPTRNSAASSILDPRCNSLFDDCMNAMMGDDPIDSPVPRLDCGRRRRESEDSTTLNELSWWSNDSGPPDDGPSTPLEKFPTRKPDSRHSDMGESDKSGWELLTKMRKFLPSTPPSLKTSVTFGPDSSSVAVRRSFTSPAFFTMVTPPNNSAVCLQPFAPDKRESGTSNHILTFLEGQGKLGLDLMDEALPPPAIMVSPPTATTLNLCRQSMMSLDQFADALDPWSIAYEVAPNLNASSAPAAFNVEVGRGKGDASVIRPPRPPKSRRRTYVQQQVESY